MAKNQTDSRIIDQLIAVLTKGNAHATFAETVDHLPFEKTGITPPGLPYSIWKLVEHIRITQWDILEFSRNAGHRSPKWPDEYWPEEPAPESIDAWNNALKQILSDRDEFIALLNDPEADLFKPFPHGDGQNLLREALLIADHTSYHTGQILILRRLLGEWHS